MNKEVLDDLQYLGLDETITVQELKRRWRYLSSHTHPDRYNKDTPEFEEALSRQKRLNNAKDRILAFIKEKDSSNNGEPVENKEPAASDARCEEEFPHETNNTQTTQDTQQKTVSPTMEAALSQDQYQLRQELFSVGVFLATMFAGVIAASLVSMMLPFLATTAPVILIAVMLTTMAGAFIKVKDWSEKYPEIVSKLKGETINAQ